MAQQGSGKKEDSIQFEKIAEDRKFKALLRKKKLFIIPVSIFFMLFYFSLPVLSAYTTILNHPAIGSITWAWVLAFAQFVMTWILCTLYVRRSAYFDRVADEVVAEQLSSGKESL